MTGGVVRRDGLREAVTGQALIAAERTRQVEVEGWTAEHDAEHGPDALIRAANAYQSGDMRHWPWDAKWWKPKDRLSNLIRAGALYQAAADLRGSESSLAMTCATEIDGILARARVLDAVPDVPRDQFGHPLPMSSTTTNAPPVVPPDPPAVDRDELARLLFAYDAGIDWDATTDADRAQRRADADALLSSGVLVARNRRTARVLSDIAAERASHTSRGWTSAHDAEHGRGHLVDLAARTASRHERDKAHGIHARRDLVKAASLLVAAVELIDSRGTGEHT